MSISGGKGNSRAQTESSSTTTNTQTTVNQVDNSIHTVDAGALQTAADISGHALELGQRALDSNSSVAIAGLDAATDLADVATDRISRFAGDALATNADVTSQALSALSDAGAGILDFASELFGTAIGAQSDLADQQIAGYTSLATQNTATSDDRLQKVVLYIVVAAAVAFVAAKVLK